MSTYIITYFSEWHSEKNVTLDLIYEPRFKMIHFPNKISHFCIITTNFNIVLFKYTVKGKFLYYICISFI